ncbi:MAG: hypothetical protein U0Z26_03135 [Anaerolineales bacterium]
MQTAPLTPEQQNWLRTNTYLPVIVLAIVLLFLVGIFICLFVGLAGNPFFIGFTILAGILLLAVTAAVGLHIYNHAMDLKDGVAQICTAKLIRKHETSRAPRTFYAEFEEVGSVTVTYEDYEKLENSKLYRVTYSPHTKRGWKIEEY